MANHFYAYISRMRCVKRWALMRNTEEENIQEHSHMVAVLAHALALIRTRVFGLPTDANAVAVAALYHDATEILTGDMPTPVKYYNEEVRNAYKTVEQKAAESLISMLPEDFREDYSPLLIADEGDRELHILIKAADKISALIKCLEEKKAGSSEFNSAYTGTLESIKALNVPEAQVFIDEFLPAYSMTLDELRN